MKKLIYYTSSVAIAALLVNCGQDADPGTTNEPIGPGSTTGPSSATPSNTSTGPMPTMTATMTPTGPMPTMTSTGPMPTMTSTGPMPTMTSTGPMPTMTNTAAPEPSGEGGSGNMMGMGGETGMPPAGGAGGEMAGPMPEPTTEPVAMCGNTMVEGTEACDDGNMEPGDGCEPDCTVTPAPVAITIEELVPDLEGHLVTTPCGDQPDTDDCAGGGWAINGGQLNVCQNGQLSLDVEYDVGGVPGTVYDVTMHFYGVMEPRQYNQVMRDAMGGSSRDEGGTPTPWAWAEPGANYRSLGDNNYNTYEIHVYDEAGMKRQMYFLNSDSGTGHYTMAISYEKTIPIIGGGKVQLIVYDANCRMIKNCGPSGGPGNQCGNLARSVDISGADPQPANLQQPGLGNPPQHSGQWWLIDVLNVQEAAAQ